MKRKVGRPRNTEGTGLTKTLQIRVTAKHKKQIDTIRERYMPTRSSAEVLRLVLRLGTERLDELIKDNVVIV